MKGRRLGPNDRINSTDKPLLDSPVNTLIWRPENIILAIWRPEHCLDNLVIICLCYLSYHQILIGGRRLGPEATRI